MIRGLNYTLKFPNKKKLKKSLAKRLGETQLEFEICFYLSLSLHWLIACMAFVLFADDMTITTFQMKHLLHLKLGISYHLTFN